MYSYQWVFSFGLIAGCLLSSVFGAAVGVKEAKTDKTPWELEEAITANSRIVAFNGTWITDTAFYFTANKTIYTYDAETDKTEVLVDSQYLRPYSDGRYTLSPDNKKLLIRYDVKAIFRHSYVAKYDVLDIVTKTVQNVHNGERLQYCMWATTNDRLSFVFENNVYVQFEYGVDIQLTKTGVTGEIYNGVPDWVYEEEVLSSGSAMWWSPDGKKLAIGVFNDTEVETFTYSIYGESGDPENQYPEEVSLKYPKAGSTNPLVYLKVFDLTTTNITNVDIKAPVDIVSPEHILQNVAWIDKEQLLITWLNRRQNIGSIQSCDSEGECKEVTRLSEPKGWITIGNPLCLPSGKSCLMLYWIDDWYQIWNLDLQTGANTWDSRGNFTVTSLHGYDEENKDIYYQATLPGDPSQLHVFHNDKCLSCHAIDEEGAECSSASASFSKNFTHYTLTCRGPNPSYSEIYKTKTNQKLKVWEANSAFREVLAQKLRPTVQFLNVTLGTEREYTGYIKLMLPPGLDWDHAAAIEDNTYALVVYVYGGPNSVRTTSAFTVGFETYLTTSKSIIYAIIDGRGTGYKGKNLLFTVNNRLGELEVEDQMRATRFLTQTYKFIDPERVTIWGWSYGGYMTAKTLANDTSNLFQCGVAVAPVTSWIYYDTIYTERYMGLPTEEDNLVNYEKSSVYGDVENFKTHSFLLVHGSGDDNVHLQQSLMLAKVLQRKDILFSEMLYTDENHSIGNFLVHLYMTIDNFFTSCLDVGFLKYLSETL